MSRDRSHKCMASMMSVFESMAASQCGGTAQKSSTISASQQSLMGASSASMVVCHPAFKLLTKSVPSTGNKRCLTMDPCVICCGQTPRTLRAGASVPEELGKHNINSNSWHLTHLVVVVSGTCLDRTLYLSSTRQMMLTWFVGHTSLSWRGTNGISMKLSSRFGQPRTIATGVET